MNDIYLEKSNSRTIGQDNYLGTSHKNSISEVKSVCTEVCDEAVWHHSTSHLCFALGSVFEAYLPQMSHAAGLLGEKGQLYQWSLWSVPTAIVGY